MEQDSPELAGCFIRAEGVNNHICGVYHLSKLSQLKQEAYQAGKKRDWGQAVSIYEQILELDKSNPTLINELGDLCLKSGQTPRGVKHFLNAASKYRHSGLLNNAVAIYKKVLRYDAENMNAHWFLAESRANQGLLMEGAQHAKVFLSNQENLNLDIKEIFLKRCTQLCELYPEDSEIQESLLQVFRMWNLVQEAGRTQIQLACLKWTDGDQEEAATMVEEVMTQLPELANYPEYALWQQKRGTSPQSQASSDFDAVNLGDPAGNEDDAQAKTSNEPTPPPVSQETNFGDLDFGGAPQAPNPLETETPQVESVVNVDPFSIPDSTPHSNDQDNQADNKSNQSDDLVDDGGCFNLDLGDECSFDDLIAQATSGVPAGIDEPADTSTSGPGSVDEIALPNENIKETLTGSVNLLDELLADDSGLNNPEAVREEQTISEEIGSQLGGGTDNTDPASLYEMGMVYLEMGMHDQACESFQKASAHSEFTIRAYEMWGITLLRAGKVDEAIATLTDALDVPEDGSREYLGLLYHIARAHEQGNNSEEALRLFEMIYSKDQGFLDVGRRVAKLSPVS